jgi:tripartite ATP-independent transporter DctP family solute receptor
MLRSGAIDMTLHSPIILGLFLDRRFDAFSLPWLFKDHAQARAVCDGPFGDEALGWLAEHGIVGLAWGVNGFRQLTNSKHAVRSPADLAGLKVRVAGSDIFLETFRQLGAQPLTMNFGEVITALEQGVIDSQENPLSIIESSRLYECQTHVTLWDYAYDPLILTINAKRWQTFAPEQQSLIKRCAERAMSEQRESVEADDNAIPERLVQHGMKVTRLSASQRTAFEAKARPIYERFRSQIGTGVVDRIVEAARATSRHSVQTTTTSAGTSVTR